MKHAQNIHDLYGPPLTLQELCDNVLKYANEHYLQKTELLGWGMKVEFTKHVSNTHSAPHNGITNWYVNSDKPKGYPGWYGRVWIFYNKSTDWCDDNLFPNLRLFTGSGGYGLYNCIFYDKVNIYRASNRYETTGGQGVYPLSYDFRFYQADWPSLILGHALGEENKENTTVYKFKEELYVTDK
jgi:hypothetical protein